MAQDESERPGERDGALSRRGLLGLVGAGAAGLAVGGGAATAITAASIGAARPGA